MDVRFLFSGIQEYLEGYVEDSEFGQYMLAASINEKIDQYKHIINDDTTVASILDPQTKLSLFEIGQETTDAVNKAREVFNQYHTTLTDKQAYNQHINKDDVSTTHDYFKGLKQRHLESGYKTNRTSADELERYLALPCDENVAPLLWWKAYEKEFPTLARMSSNYLSIQTTSIACEQAFSVTTNTISRTRSLLDPETSRASLCAKSWIENEIVKISKLKFK